jgi:hypothetical protein
LVPHRRRQPRRDHRSYAARACAAAAADAVGRRAGSCSRRGRSIILPEPSFAGILAIGVVPLIAYPYWRDVQMFGSWWAGVSRALLILAALAGVGLLITAAIAYPRQIGGTDEAPRGLVVGLRGARDGARAGRRARR